MPETIVLQTYETIALANMDCEVLRAQGISCFLSDENIVQLYPMFSSPFGGIKLHVFAEERARAMQILDEYHASHE